MPRQHRVPLSRETWGRFVRAFSTFAGSEVGWKAKTLFGLLLAFLLAINGLNVITSYVARDFMSAIAERNYGGFVRQAFLYLGVFGASTLAATFYRFCEERLALLWRNWLTGRLITQYLEERVYYRLSSNLANPDQRIADDTRAFTATTLSFTLMLLNASFTVIAFAGVLWSISSFLFVVAVLYAALGSLLTLVLGRPLIWLNYNQSDQEANLRSELIRVKENSQAVALLQRESRLRIRLLQRLRSLTDNWRHIIGVNRNLNLFSNGYNYLVQIIPALIIAPAYIRGEVEFGVLTQSAIAFTQLLGAFSLIVTQFQSISSFAAVVARLGSLGEAVETARANHANEIETVDDPEQVAYEHLTLESTDHQQILIRDLSVAIGRGTKLLVRGTNEGAVTALFDATAGLWPAGKGRILRPSLDKIEFIPERPYLPPGSLRQVLLPGDEESDISEAQITSALEVVGAVSLVIRAGGLTAERNWDEVFSLAEQQQLVLARAVLSAPHFVFVERLTSALDVERAQLILKSLAFQGISYAAFGTADTVLDCFDATLEIDDDGGWRWHVGAHPYAVI